ncbi:hypothetical protein HELRODRAFT_133376, partial [Helobdella robusta]|uniref:Uncharacterized protein n=1 Tax=Helobdella robusta TaxID=6412 RepID=T1EI05_HELRO
MLKVSCTYMDLDVPPIGIPLQTQVLDLSGNKLLPGSQMIIGGHDVFLPIQSIDASHNNIVYLHEDTFSKLSNLQWIDLSHNHIEIIHNNLFNNLTRGLKWLDLSNNRIASLADARWLNGLRGSLIHFNLSQNNVHVVSKSTINWLPGLLSFDISRNSLKYVDNGALKNLKILDLSFNNFNSIAPFTFANSSTLKMLNINNNGNLKVIREYSFVKMTALKEINLNDNQQLLYIDHKAFKDLPRLRTLNLKRCFLVTLQDGIIRNLPSLVYLDLSEN